MNIIEQLEELNWKPYDDPTSDADYSYEHWITHDGLKLYVIHCSVYDIKPYIDDLQAMYTVQFTRNNGQIFNVELLSGTPEEAVEFFEEIYGNMNCQPYE